MKKFVLLLGMLFALQAVIMAQDVTTGNITFNAHLEQTFNLIVTNQVQEITFASAADYNDGVVAGGGILPGTSDVSVEATEDWNLTIACPDFLPFGATPGTGVIPIENLGYVISANGAHKLATFEVTYTTGTVALTVATTPLISLGTVSNAGDVTDNWFTLTFEMGTLILQGGTPPLGSMFDQMANGDFTTGDFQAIALLTLNTAP